MRPEPYDIWRDRQCEQLPDRKLLAATMAIGGKVRRIEQREDGLWYLAFPDDQVDLGGQGKPYYEWYEMSDFVKVNNDLSSSAAQIKPLTWLLLMSSLIW